MTGTRTPGITTGANGQVFIDKRYRGIRIGMRVGAITQEQAEHRLQAHMHDIDVELARRAHPRPTFADCAARYLAQSREKAHVRDDPSARASVESHPVLNLTVKGINNLPRKM